MIPSRTLLAGLIAAALAGCLEGGDVGLPGSREASQLIPLPLNLIEVDHDHRNVKLHAIPVGAGASAASLNLDRISYHSGYGDGTSGALPAGQGFAELFVRDGLAFVGRRGGNDGGFVIVDVKNPLAPKLLGTYPGLANYDMESTHDNRFVFFASQYLNNQQPSSIPPNDPGEIPRGVHIVDVFDPASPKEAGLFPVPTRGAHTLTYHRTDAGRELLAVQTYDFLPDPSLGLPLPSEGINPLSQRVLLLEFVRTPLPHLQLLSTFEKHEAQPPLNYFFPHDTSIQKHPVTNELILYVAYWNLGAILVDITDPSNPLELSSLTDFSPSKIFNIHLAAPSDRLIDGRHVTVTEPELAGPLDETGQYTLFDTTDPRKPFRLGHWRLPGNLGNDADLRFSPHNFDVEDGRIYLAHYHAGVWVIDIHNETLLRDPEAVAVAFPNEPRAGYGGDAPNVWTALRDGDHVYASDIASGLYVYQFAGDRGAAAVE